MNERSTKPPPTRYGQPPTVQRAPANPFARPVAAGPKAPTAQRMAAGVAPPPTRYGTAPSAQPKRMPPAPNFAAGRPGVLQRASAGSTATDTKTPAPIAVASNYAFASGHIDFTDRTREHVTEGVGGGMTIHHKISQAHLKRLTRSLGIIAEDGGAEQKGAASKLIGVLQIYMAGKGDRSSSVFRLLNNMPLNLAYGPTSRWHHMGDRFDPTVDTASGEDATSEVETHKTPKPALYRALTPRSAQLSVVDQQIMALPEDKVAMSAAAKTPAMVGLLNGITAALQAAITADASDTKTPFYSAGHWAKSEDKYTRATTAAVFKTWDPDMKPTLSQADKQRADLLSKFRDGYRSKPIKQGIKVRVGGLVDELFRVLLMATDTYTKDSVEARYGVAFGFADGIRKNIGTAAIKWKPGKEKPSKPALTEDSPDVDYFDLTVAEALADLKYVTGG